MERLKTAEGSWTIERRPTGSDATLRGWNAADLYLLKHAEEGGLLSGDRRVVVVNDEFGALGIGTLGARPQWWSDSYRSAQALDQNLGDNDLDADLVTVVPGDQAPEGPIDLVLLRFPKSLAWLQDQLLRLRPHLAPGATVVAGGMIKHTPKRAFELLETCIGPTKTSLGWKKARLAFAEFDPQLKCKPGVAPKVVAVDGQAIGSRPNVFSWDHLDLGARILLRNLGSSDTTMNIIDQGCGNGVLALALAKAYPDAVVLGVDESYQAVASARDNAAAVCLSEDHVHFEVADDLADATEDEADLIVCNPPFHQAHSVGDQVAWGMFVQARRALAKGGEYRVVGNRHMHYHDKLKRLFGNYEILDSDKRFVVLRSTKR